MTILDENTNWINSDYKIPDSYADANNLEIASEMKRLSKVKYMLY